MIKSFTVTNYLGDSIKIELGRPEQSGFLIKSVSGLGPSKANINTTEVSTNDGSLFNSARLNQRNIVFEFIFVEQEQIEEVEDDVYFLQPSFPVKTQRRSVNRENIEDVRQKSYKYFPLKKNLDLLIETDNRIVKTTGYVESNEPNIFSSQEGSQISIICPDPYFYSAGPDGNNTTVFYGIESVFEFPFSNESLTDPLIVFGNIQNKTENVITYNGDSEIGIIIQIHAIGEAENITIYNTGTRQIMRIDTTKLENLTGSGIVAGDDIIINTSKGDKSIKLIRSGESINILNCLDKGTDWFTLAKGDNIFAFSAEFGTTNLQFQIKNKIIYEGV